MKFLDIQATLECGFTLKNICDIITTYSQMHYTGKYSQHSSITWPVWLNGWVFIYELSGFGFKSHCSLLNFRYCSCFKQEVPWQSGNSRVWIHSETHTWYDINIQPNVMIFYKKSNSIKSLSYGSYMKELGTNSILHSGCLKFAEVKFQKCNKFWNKFFKWIVLENFMSLTFSSKIFWHNFSRNKIFILKYEVV